MKKDLAYWTDEIQLHDPSDRDYLLEEDKHRWPPGWWGVSHPEKSIVAYFLEEEDANGYRLDLIKKLSEIKA